MGGSKEAKKVAFDTTKQPQQGKDVICEEEEIEYKLALGKVTRVLLPIIFLNGALGHFEKGNLAFAALQLNKQMGFSALEYGVGSGLYFLGYGAFILPSTFMTIKYGARRWLGITTFLCGVIGVMHVLISNRPGFYVLRCLLGMAEAGGGSSAGHLLAQFYPKSKLAQPFTIMMLSYFAAGIMAAPLATGLMSMDGLGNLYGWQWLFMLEAVPSLVIGVVIYVWLPSHPLEAQMLTQTERELVHLKVHNDDLEEAEAARPRPQWSQLLGIVWNTLKRPLLWFFTAVSLLHGMSFFSFHPWTTIIINNMLHGTATHGSTSSGAAQGPPSPHAGGHGPVPIKAILLSAVPAVTGSIGAVLCAWHSDRVNEKHLHVALPWLVSGVLLALFGPMVALSFVAGFITLTLAKTFSAASSGVMSSLLVGCLDIKHAGIGLALHHAVVACVGGFAGPVFVGAMVQRTGSFGSAMVLNGCLQIASALMMVGLAGWVQGWCRTRPHEDSLFLAPSVGLPSALAAAMTLEEAPGTIPDLTEELSLSRLQARNCALAQMRSMPHGVSDTRKRVVTFYSTAA